MILGSDSHTRYGALGTMAVGEGGGELVKQLLEDTYDVACPQVMAIYLDGAPKPGTGPQDIALAIIGAVFKNGYVKNKVMEFVGPGRGLHDHGLPQRGGCDDNRDHLPFLHLAHGRGYPGVSGSSTAGRKPDDKKLDPAGRTLMMTAVCMWICPR